MRALVFLFAILATAMKHCDSSDECGPEEFCDGLEYWSWESGYHSACQF